jgi:thiol-disulfide isomerase/thioredoxin
VSSPCCSRPPPGPFDLSTTLGKPTVVNFFASWCPSCAAESADLAAFAAAHPELAVVGVAVNDKSADIERFVMWHGIEYPVILDTTGLDGDAWGVTGIPATFFLDAQGRTVTSIVGAATRAQFEEALDTVR